MQVKVETSEFIPVIISITLTSSKELRLFTELCGANWSVAKTALKDSEFEGESQEEAQLARMLASIHEAL